ncbi:hypothetical protein BDV37DRAFT_270001 [Aspergillus pseudonomiae]|uniref:3-hydroxyacyl-CoA dehydrogenase n=1 Tax=Aspergillus pseudonomiae TaxID=1506151 RepID=A0A5N7DJE9_9EURO|nr:uncharacterized protein BDV37DRAFT_270001 [Aspergillus pseudonomiae]KAE8406395.1 hypothetical protein BDV37DRAFT_270001 [Aspergillus pseudonomiae]
MTRFDPNHESLDFLKLRDSVVVLTGGATGIGAATVRLLHSYGAKVIFGDINTEAAKTVVYSTSPDTIHFVETDVRSYEDNLALFKYALSKYGRVDHAIANAGTLEQKGWFDPRQDVNDIEVRPSTLTLDVNLVGALVFTHIACSYLAHGNEDGKIRDKSLTLLGSHGGFKETPGMFLYSMSKHAIMGLLRSLRIYVLEAFPGLRVNAVCPSMTETMMVGGIRDVWIKQKLPVNQPNDIATAILGILSAGPGTNSIWHDEDEAPGLNSRDNAGQMDWEDVQHRGLHGRAIYVLGGKCFDIEEGLDRTEQLWLGRNASATMKQAQEVLGLGDRWLQ